MNRLMDLLMKDIGWKLLSVFIAIGLWLMVINIENPVETRLYSIPVKLENMSAIEDAGMIITNVEELKITSISIRVRAERLSLDRLSQQRASITATADVSRALEGATADGLALVPVEVKLPTAAGSSFEIIAKSLSALSVEIQKLTQIEKAVVLEINGGLQKGYTLENTALSPDKVKISGAQKAVESVSSVKAIVTLESGAKNFETKVVPVAVDVNGAEVKNVTLDTTEIEVSIGINKSVKVPVKVSTQGEVRDGYEVRNISWTPETLELLGSDSSLVGISEIAVPIINIEDRATNATVHYQAYQLLPVGVRLRSGASEDISVLVEIGPREEVEKSFELPSAAITVVGTVPNGMKAEMQAAAIRFTLKGSQAVLDSISPQQLKPTVHIASAVEGSHVLQVQMTLPEGALFYGTAPQVTLRISATQTPEQPTTTPPILPETEDSANDSNSGTNNGTDNGTNDGSPGNGATDGSGTGSDGAGGGVTGGGSTGSSGQDTPKEPEQGEQKPKEEGVLPETPPEDVPVDAIDG